MKRFAIAGLVLVSGCAYTPENPHANPGDASERLLREGARGTMSSTQGSFLAAACYATAVNNRSDGLTANAARDGAEDRWGVTVRETRRPEHVVAVVNVDRKSVV